MIFLQILGGILLALAAIFGLIFVGYLQTTWNMTDEEKAALLKHIQENGFLGSDDDFF